MKEYSFKVPSMHDEISAKEIASIITGIRGIEDVNVNFEEGLVEVFYDENQTAIDKIKLIVEDRGYEIKNL